MSLAHIVTSLLGQSETLDAKPIIQFVSPAEWLNLRIFNRYISTTNHQLSKVLSCYTKMSKRIPGRGHSGVGICSPSSCGGTLGWFQFLGDAPWSPSFFSRKRPVTAVTHTDFRHVSQFVGHFYECLMAWFTYLDDLMRCLPSFEKSQPGHLRKLSEARIALLRFIFEDVEQSALQAVFLILGRGN